MEHCRENGTDGMMRLWRECFGDDEAYVRDYLQKWRPLGKSFVREADGETVSAADVHMFNSCGIDVAYIFGVMTDRRYRGAGLATSLVSEILRCTRRGGCCLAMLIAGDDNLAEWYRGFGFSSRFAEPATLVSPDGSFDFGTGCTEMNKLQYRITDVPRYLAIYSARINPAPSRFCVTDPVIEENNGVFAVAGGKVVRCTHKGTGQQVTVSQLADFCPPGLSHFSYVGRRG